MRVQPHFVTYLLNRYFKPKDPALKRFSIQPPKYNTRPSKGAKVTPRTITDEEIAFLTNSDNLRAWAPYSLAWRCTLFHRQFPDRWLDRFTLGQLYRNAGIKKKAIAVRRAPQRKTQRLQEFEDRILELHEQVERIVSTGGHLVFIDESIFTSQGF